MKQNITVEQFKKLSVQKQKEMRYWLIEHRCKPTFVAQEGCLQPAPKDVYYLFNIGLMIEFLHEDYPTNITDAEEWYITIWTKPKNSKEQKSDHEYSKSFHGIELCDALWDAVKEKLEAVE